MCSALQQNIVLLTCTTVLAIVVYMYHSHARQKICNIASWSLVIPLDWFIVHICILWIQVVTQSCVLYSVFTNTSACNFWSNACVSTALVSLHVSIH